MTSSHAKRAKLNKLIREYVNPDYSFTSWKRREIKNSKGELVAGFDDGPAFFYQFEFEDELSQGKFLAELREALALQQVVLSEAERESPSVTRFSSGLVVGDPYLYSKGQIHFFYDSGSRIKAQDKFRTLIEEYLVRRMPDLEEARRVLSETVPKLTQADLEIRRLREENRWLKIGKHRRLRGETGTDILQEIHVAAEFDENCRILGIDPGIFKDMTNEEARKYVEGLRKTWAGIYHDKGGYADEMKAKNNAADHLIDYLNGRWAAGK